MVSRQSSLDEIKNLVRKTITELYDRDQFLFKRNKGKGVCERSIVFRFAHYLQINIHDFYVDCDFNSSYEGYIDLAGNVRGREREGKPIENPDRTITKRFVDIIVHKRDFSSNISDFICFEIKKWNNSNLNDLEKDRNNLRDLTSRYGYIYGFHISFHKIRKMTKWTIFQNGRIIENNSLVFENAN
jgi:hypothetical protein